MPVLKDFGLQLDDIFVNFLHIFLYIVPLRATEALLGATCTIRRVESF